MRYPEIPGYQVLHPLGKGGMASVFAAIELELDRKVAIKLVTLKTDETQGKIDSGAWELFERLEIEARALAKLRHPHIVELYRFGRITQADGALACYYVMPLLAGGDLARWLKPAPEYKVQRLLDKLLQALDHAHEAGIVHRDIKPENILFDGEHPLLADFGAAFTVGQERMTQTGFSIGSVGYMSPEQARGHVVNGASDLYSLAVLAFELLSGSRPHQGNDALAIALAQVEKPVPSLAELGLGHWDTFFAQAMAAKPEQRYLHANAMRQALSAIAIDSEAGDGDTMGRSRTEQHAANIPTSASDPNTGSPTRLRSPNSTVGLTQHSNDQAPATTSTPSRPTKLLPATKPTVNLRQYLPAFAGLAMAISAIGSVWLFYQQNQRAELAQRSAVLEQELRSLPLDKATLRLTQLRNEAAPLQQKLAGLLLQRMAESFAKASESAPLASAQAQLEAINSLRSQHSLAITEPLQSSIAALALRNAETLRLSIELWDREGIRQGNDLADALLKSQALTPAAVQSLEELLITAAKLPKPGDHFELENGLKLRLLQSPAAGTEGRAMFAAPLSTKLYQKLMGKPLECPTPAPNSAQNCVSLTVAREVVSKLNALPNSATKQWRFELPDQAMWLSEKQSAPRLENYFAIGPDCVYQTTSQAPNVAAKTWGGIKRVFGGQGARPRVSRRCTGQQSFALDGKGTAAQAAKERTVLVLFARLSL